MEELDDLRVAHAKLEDENGDLKDEIKMLKESIQEYKKTIDKLKYENDDLKDDKKEYRSLCSKLESALTLAQQKNKILNEIIEHEQERGEH